MAMFPKWFLILISKTDQTDNNFLLCLHQLGNNYLVRFQKIDSIFDYI